MLYTVAIVAQHRGRRFSDSAAAAKAEVSRLGFGKRVDVKLNDGRKANGRITGFANDCFVVTAANGATTTVAYSEVSGITKQKEKPDVFDAPWKGIMFTAAVVVTAVEVTMEFFN